MVMILNHYLLFPLKLSSWRLKLRGSVMEFSSNEPVWSQSVSEILEKSCETD